jgi:hypothetical protein
MGENDAHRAKHQSIAQRSQRGDSGWEGFGGRLGLPTELHLRNGKLMEGYSKN